MIDLSGRVCLITGAGQGIGQAVAEGFAQRGAVVVATSLDKPQCEGVALNIAWDVADAQAAPRIVNEVLQRFGRLDAFVANAGIYPRQEWDEISTDDWHDVLGVNLDGAWHGSQAVGKVMAAQGYGKIVLVSSVEVLRGTPVHAHYVSAKAGIVGLTRSLARALGPSGVRVNCLMPGAVLTPTELEQFPDQEAVARLVDELQCLPGRIEGHDIEPSFAFLSSQESDAITGQVLCVDHGLMHW